MFSNFMLIKFRVGAQVRFVYMLWNSLGSEVPCWWLLIKHPSMNWYYLWSYYHKHILFSPWSGAIAPQLMFLKGIYYSLNLWLLILQSFLASMSHPNYSHNLHISIICFPFILLNVISYFVKTETFTLKA